MSTLKTTNITHASNTGTANMVLASDGSVTFAGGSSTDSVPHRNLIINGSMQVAQRGTTAVAETGYKSVDRWQLSYAGHDEALNQQQVDVSVGSSPYNLPVGSGHPYAHGFRKCFQVQNGNQTSGAGAGDFAQIVYKPEGQDINRSGWNYTDPNSKLTLSFWVKSSVAQNFYGFIEAGSPTRIFGFETGTLVAHTWTKVTAVIPGYASLVIPDTTAAAFSLAIIPFYGTNYTHASNRPVGTWYEAYNYFPDMASTWWTTNDATFQFTGVQLELGDTGTTFEHRSFDDELGRCQRYFQSSYKYGNAVGSNTDWTNSFNVVSWADGNAAGIQFRKHMRASPTVTLRRGDSNGTGEVLSGGQEKSATAQNIGTGGFQYINITSGVASTYVNLSWVAESEL